MLHRWSELQGRRGQGWSTSCLIVRQKLLSASAKIFSGSHKMISGMFVCCRQLSRRCRDFPVSLLRQFHTGFTHHQSGSYQIHCIHYHCTDSMITDWSLLWASSSIIYHQNGYDFLSHILPLVWTSVRVSLICVIGWQKMWLWRVTTSQRTLWLWQTSLDSCRSLATVKKNYFSFSQYLVLY